MIFKKRKNEKKCTKCEILVNELFEVIFQDKRDEVHHSLFNLFDLVCIISKKRNEIKRKRKKIPQRSLNPVAGTREVPVTNCNNFALCSLLY